MERESRSLEYKREVSDLKKIARTVVAFANGVGGEIVVGVEDKSREVLGLAPIEIEDLLEKLPVSLADQIRPPIFPMVYSKTVESKELVVVQVFPGGQRPYYLASEGLERGVYVRVGAHTRRAEGELLEDLRLCRQRITYDQAPELRCDREELDFSLLPASMRAEKALFSLDLLHRDAHTAEVYPSRGAILMFHPHPEKYVPEAELIVSRMRGVHGRNTIETHTFNGPIPSLAEQTLDILLRWLGREPRLVKGRYSAQKHQLPPEALREALHNALFHRQYSIPGAVKVALYVNRLEIFSPGHFAGPFVPSALGDGTSYIRNPVICALARRLELMEKRGTGIAVMQSEVSKYGLPPPRFEEGANWFKVIFFTEPAVAIAALDPGNAIMQLFEHQASISSADVRRVLKVSKATAIAHVEKLLVQEILEKEGAGPKTRYVLRRTA